MYTGYPHDKRVCYEGLHPPRTGAQTHGRVETKKKLITADIAIPAGAYDLRIGLSEERVSDSQAGMLPPEGWTEKRVKRRRSYSRGDGRGWIIDVTEVTTTFEDISKPPKSAYEIEVEFQKKSLVKLVNERDPAKLKILCAAYGSQLGHLLSQLNPLSSVANAEEALQNHPNLRAVELARAQCGALKKIMNTGANVSSFSSPIGTQGAPSPALGNIKFPGCMPVNFARHNIEQVQHSPESDYFLSEKTDGVRHFMIFTGDAVVLLDRNMTGKQPIPVGGAKGDPLGHLIQLIRLGTVFDGEVVMHRGRPGTKDKPRPIFIVFDVLAISSKEPILHLPFGKRYHKHLKPATFRTPHCSSDIFDERLVFDRSVALPLVRKKFVGRRGIDHLLQHVQQEHGIRTYRNGDAHNHTTDGIIFQPNRPYVCGTDHHLLKWKYLDTVTIDVEINDEGGALRFAVLGEEGSKVDMTRHIRLPESECLKLEADRLESGLHIAEVGLNPETGEWYFSTMRPDKSTPNHISTVLGTFLELAESLATEELCYRMCIPEGARDTYRLDLKKAQMDMVHRQRNNLRHRSHA